MREVMNMIEVGTKIVGNWGAGYSYSYGVVTATYEFRGRKQVVVDFDDLDVLTEYSENEFCLPIILTRSVFMLTMKGWCTNVDG